MSVEWDDEAKLDTILPDLAVFIDDLSSTSADIAETHGVTEGGVDRLLSKLEGLGLVLRDERGRWWLTRTGYKRLG